MEALIAFNWYRCDSKPNLEIADHAVMAAKASGAQRFIASAVWCLGLTYVRLGNHGTSYHHIQEAYQLFNTLPPGEVESQRLGGICGIDLVENARFILQADEVVSLARDIEKKCTALSDDLVHGRSLLNLGIALNEVQQQQEALYYMDRARTMFKAVGHTLNLARAYHVISFVHLDEHRLPEALDTIEEAWKYAELTASRQIEMTISLTLGRILFNNNRDTEAWKYIEISLTNASYIGNRLHVARALEYMGYGYLRRGDYQNAYGAYEAAAEKYIGTVDADDARLCKKNMAKIKRKQESPDAVVGFNRPGLDFDKSRFYPPVQAFASEPPISHS
jgi:tetratricopeptide (TPR) repeat protein